MTDTLTAIKVGLDFGSGIQPVGRLALRDHIIYFAYNDAFLAKNLAISPFRLPLRSGLVVLPQYPFDGLAGVFSDSLPDGWGRLLFDRMISAQGISPTAVTPLDRLAYVGLQGMGALVYEPDNGPSDAQKSLSLDHIAIQSQKVLRGDAQAVIDKLLALNGSAAGAHPKALIGLDTSYKQIMHGSEPLPPELEAWLVKFPNMQDGTDAGAIEYVYALMAKEAGIAMPEVYLFPSQNTAGYFGIKRFDRQGNKRLHMHSASGLLHTDFRAPALDYEDLLTLTGTLTKDRDEMVKMYRLAVFNVLAHNRDDHAKNFSFLMDEAGTWKPAPAYDLTFSSGPAGEQSTMVMGEGKNPGKKDLVKLGTTAGLTQTQIAEIIAQTRAALEQWETHAKTFGVHPSNIKAVSRALTANR